MLALAAASLVPSGKGPIQVYGFPDVDSCGSWVEQRRSTSGNQANEGWVLGFISGLNWFGDGNNGNIAPGVNAQGLLAWVDQYCAAHPLDSVSKAGFELAKELNRRSHG